MTRGIFLRVSVVGGAIAMIFSSTPASAQVAAASAAAAATEISAPSLPQAPQSPTDFQDVARPSGNVPADIGASSASAADSGRSSAAAGYSGGDLVISEGGGALYASRNLDSIPEFHKVRNGDSLWGICDYYYRDPWFWPRLWAENPAITNPHWIYPGDRIRLVGGESEQAVASEEPRQDSHVMRLSGRTMIKDGGPIKLRQTAFIDPKELRQSGSIIGSKVEHAMLTISDELYLEGDDQFKPAIGKTYSVYKVREVLEDDDEVLGHIVDVLGSVRVKRINDKGIATAVVVQAVAAITRGDRIGPLRRTFKRLNVKPAKQNLQGRIIGNVNQTKYIGADDLVFINRGRQDGVLLGNRFLVVRRGDGHRVVYQDLEQDDPRFPEETVAEVAVLDVRDNASVGVVTRATKELRNGDKLRMRRGY